jgi:glycosyltransferase involved in cell wall biosynthesis
MQLVSLSPFPVWPAHSGGKQAVLGLTLALSGLGPTRLIWTERKTKGPRRIEHLGQTLDALAVPNLWWQRSLARALRRFLGRVDIDVGSGLCSGFNGALRRPLEAAAAQGEVVFLLAHPWLWPALRPVLQRHPQALLVYDAHNVEYRLKQQEFPPGWVAERVVAQVRRLEAALVQRADLTLACTEADAAELQALAGVGPGRFLVGSKATSPSARADAAVVARAARAAGRVAVFVGSEHPPNVEAARWIAEVLAPAAPAWQFEIVGRCGPPAVQGLAGTLPPNLSVLGPVDDLVAVLAQADVALNPMRAGSGINMKLFEMMQCGLPVLSTPLGARGLEGLAAGALLREREAFAAALVALAGDPGLLKVLSADAARCAREHFEWPVVGARIRARIEALMAARRQTR